MEIDPTLRKLFEKYSEINCVYLFGSRARDQNQKKSDWDYGILTIEVPLSVNALLEIIRDLEHYHRTSVDVVDLRNVPPLLSHRIIHDRKIVFERNPLLRVNFEARLLCEYLDWTQFLEVHRS
ncbi:MAG: hypothetical protein RBG13Loki_1678 [Promethearchaeota archaeon CR_4]|nr:MAG: hypothetical protein RBG13Loki_1678 [Candidatus Lokiarchaeota archaeon CR_4]